MKLEISLELFNRIAHMLRERAEANAARAATLHKNSSTNFARATRDAADKANRDFIEFTTSSISDSPF